MNCPHCGNNVRDDALFCTECGLSLQQKMSPSPSQSTETVPVVNREKANYSNGIVAKVNTIVEKYGARTISKWLSIIVITTIGMLSLLGSLVCALLVTAVNGYLIFRCYKSVGRVDKELLIWGCGAILIWLLLFFV